MNDQKRKLPSSDAGMSFRELEASIRRIEDDLYFNPDNIGVRLTRIEEKLEHVAMTPFTTTWKSSKRTEI